MLATQTDALIRKIVLMSQAESNRQTIKGRIWTAAEDDFLRRNLGWLTDDEIGTQLGRSEIAVHLRWSRDLHLPSPSKHPDVITANQAAEMLGIDSHKTAHWVDMGLIPGRIMPGEKKIRLIRRVHFMMFACSPKNWVWFNPKKVADPHLKRLLKLAQKRWGDEWWTLPQVAKYHGVDTRVVDMHVARIKDLPGYHLPISLGGRDFNRRWSNWFVRKSDAVAFRFLHRGDYSGILTPRGLKWMKKALRMGWSYAAIARSMKVSSGDVIHIWEKRFVEVKS
jgi:hypothetical protein